MLLKYNQIEKDMLFRQRILLCRFYWSWIPIACTENHFRFPTHKPVIKTLSLKGTRTLALGPGSSTHKCMYCTFQLVAYRSCLWQTIITHGDLDPYLQLTYNAQCDINPHRLATEASPHPYSSPSNCQRNNPRYHRESWFWFSTAYAVKNMALQNRGKIREEKGILYPFNQTLSLCASRRLHLFTNQVARRKIIANGWGKGKKSITKSIVQRGFHFRI